ncbi:MAG: hypothetical protein JO307_03355 [Bryobacterales bacterium]|nr:hypothetical protein [Bryobacterales bacterium]
MMVLLDMPAMTLTVLALLFFLDERYALCAVACVGLVLVKETSVTTPAVFVGWLWFKGRRREALYFVAPAAALAMWLFALRQSTGHWLGNEEFAQYNVTSALDPLHIAFAFASRTWFLFVSDGHWIGTVALLLGWRLLRSPEWNLALTVGLAQVIIVTVFGGAELERYLVPVLPVLYAAMATAALVYRQRWRWISAVAMLAFLVAGWFWNAPYPRPYEDNLDMVNFVRTNQDAAQYLEEHYPNARVASAWPFTAALRHPEFGYVRRSMNVLEAPGLHLAELKALGRENFDIAVIFTNKPPSRGRLLNLPLLRRFVRHYYDFAPQATREEIRTGLGFVPVRRWQRGDQWIEIYAPER